MNEIEFQAKTRNLFEDLRGHTDCFIIRLYWSIDEKGNVLLDEDSLREDFENKTKEILEVLK